MKKINFHLLVVIAILMGGITFNWESGNETFLFFGFAENKEMEIRLENPVAIEHILVTPGVQVKKGDVLIEVTRSGLDLTQSDLNHEVARLQSQLKIWESDLNGSISQLEGQRIAKESAIRSQIEQLASELSINQSLIKDLESISPVKDRAGLSPNEIKIRSLRNELLLTVRPLNSEIMRLRNELFAVDNPIKIQIRKLQGKLGFVHQEEDKLRLLAPNDGVVGTIFCEVGEKFSPFTTLLTYYDQNPTQVKGYVLESLILKINIGDELVVHSAVQSTATCMGKVIGMGSRIIEIPERLRKNPGFKTYGREILIEIPANNKFLQKEKVVLKFPSGGNQLKSGIDNS